MSMTITVDASAAAFRNGVNLRVEVLRNAAPTQNGASASSGMPGSSVSQKALTTTVVGSRVYGSGLNGNTSLTVNGSTTAIDNIADTTNTVRYGTCKQKTDTTSTGSETIGWTNTLTDGGVAFYEVVPVAGQTLVEDLCAPAVVTNKTGTTATTAGFTPPQGSLLVVMASALTNGAFTISDTLGLTWTKQASASTDGSAVVWTARVPDPNPGDPYIAAIGGWSGVTSTTLPLLHDVAVGDALIVETSASSGTGSSVTDTQSNSYSFDQTVTTSQNNANFTAKATTALKVADSDTITAVRSSATGQGTVIVIGIPNAIASSPVEGSTVSKVSSGTSTAPSVTSGTLGQANEILIACQTASNHIPVWSSPFDLTVLANEEFVSTGINMSVAWLRTSATTAVTAAATIPTSAAWEMMLTAVKVSISIGSISMHKMGLSGSGGERESGTGSVRMHKMAPAVTAATTSLVTATGFIKMNKMGSSDSGKETEVGTGSVAMHKMGLGLSGKETEVGTGSVSMHKMGLADIGIEKFTATGSVKMHKMGFGLSGKETEAGTGSVSMHKMAVHGIQAGVVQGTGSVSRHKMGLAASGDPQSIRLDNNAEGGTNGTTVSTANSGGVSGQAFDIVSIGTAATLTFDNTHPAHGLMGFKFVTGSPAANSFLGWQTPITTGPLVTLWARKYYYQTGYSSTQLRLMRATSAGTLRAAVAVDSTGHVILLDASGTGQKTSTSVVPLNAKYRLEARFTGDASNGQIQCLMFTTNPESTVPDEIVTTSATINTGGTITRVDWGNPSSVASYTFWGDEPSVSTRGYPGPVPMASVARHKMGLAATGSMAGPDLRNNFSGLTNGTTLTTGNTGGSSGRPFDSVSIPSGGTLAADNTELGLDAMALKVATSITTGTPFAQWSKTGSLGYDRTKVYFRCDQLITTSATPAFRPFALRTTGGTHIFSPLISGNAVSCSYGSAFTGLTAFTGSIANNKYFRLEGYIDTVAGTVHIELYTNQKDAFPSQTKDFTGVVFGNNVQRIDIGNANSAASDGPFWIDEVGFSETGKLSPPSVSMHKMGLGSSGKEIEAGTGLVSRHKMGVAVTGHVAYGSVRMHKMGLSDAGTEKFIGTGSVRMHKQGLGSAGKETEAGTGSVRMRKMGVAASGTESGAIGTASVHMHKMGLSVAARETESGTGNVRAPKMGISIIAVETFFITGGVRTRKMGVSGNGLTKLSFHLSGGVAMHKMHVLGRNPPIESGSLFVFTQV